MASQILPSNTFTTAKWIVSSTSSDGTHTTIQAAINSAASGDTIFIRPGTYTENLTLKAGVNLTAFGSDSSLNATGVVIISGNATFTGTGSVTISGIQLQTNSAALLTISGSNASVVNINNCYLNCTNNTGITYSSSNASSAINLYYCTGNLGTTGIGFHTMSSTGKINYFYCSFTNTGSSLSVTNNSAGTANYIFSMFFNAIGTTSTGAIGINNSQFDTSVINTISLTVNGSGSASSSYSGFSSGTASAVTIGTGASLAFVGNGVGSSNTNAITGLGSISSYLTIFSGSSRLINTTTQSGTTLQGNISGNAPSAGFIGERITANATAVATTNSTPKTIISINVTAGVWDISGSFASIPTGGTAVMSAVAFGISTTNNTLGSTLGIDYGQLSVAALGAVSLTVPLVRATLSATTTYYLVVNNVYTATTCPTNALISATRVG